MNRASDTCGKPPSYQIYAQWKSQKERIKRKWQKKSVNK